MIWYRRKMKEVGLKVPWKALPRKKMLISLTIEPTRLG